MHTSAKKFVKASSSNCSAIGPLFLHAMSVAAMDIIILRLNFADAAPTYCDANCALDSLYLPSGSDPSVDATFRISSYGRLQLQPRELTRVLDINMGATAKDYTDARSEDCPVRDMANDASALAIEQHGVDPRAYTFREFFLPAFIPTCPGWKGLATTGCAGRIEELPSPGTCLAWYRVGTPWVRAHELGHNLGLSHAGGQSDGFTGNWQVRAVPREHMWSAHSCGNASSIPQPLFPLYTSTFFFPTSRFLLSFPPPCHALQHDPHTRTFCAVYTPLRFNISPLLLPCGLVAMHVAQSLPCSLQDYGDVTALMGNDDRLIDFTAPSRFAAGMLPPSHVVRWDPSAAAAATSEEPSPEPHTPLGYASSRSVVLQPLDLPLGGAEGSAVVSDGVALTFTCPNCESIVKGTVGGSVWVS